MGLRFQRYRRSLAAGLVLAVALPLRATEMLPLAVEGGRCECVLATGDSDDKFFLILGCLARTAGPHRVTVRTGPTSDPTHVSLAAVAPPADWKSRVQDLAARQARARQEQRALPLPAPAQPPPAEKVFALLTGGQDFRNPDSYTTLRAELRAVGQHCQVYVDRDDRGAALDATIADAIRTFDEEVYPRARRTLGTAADVDGDGRFTILLTHWLGRLQGGRVAVSGFVRGSDFYRELRQPFGNGCDMMYLNTDLRPGPHLRTVLAHEFTHAVVFSEHVFGAYLPGTQRADEEGWLNEALAHVVEDSHGFGWTNLDYRVSAFLNAPERYRLLVPNYYEAGLWRTPGVRGFTYLFLRWCVDRHGPDLPGRLVRSNLQGVDNLEVATGERFEALFRQWSAALLLTDTGLEEERVSPLRRLSPRQPVGGRMLSGPRFAELLLSGASQETHLAGTAVHYLQLHSPAGARSRLSISADPAVSLQVTLIRLPPSYPRLSLRAEPLPQGGTFRLHLTAHGGPVTVEGVAWERLLPLGVAADTNYRPGADSAEEVRAWLGDPRLGAGETRTGVPVALPPPSPSYVVRVAARDKAGRRVAGWALLPGAPAAPP